MCLAIRNRRRDTPRSENRFRFVLCWLESDLTGTDTKLVEDAFRNIRGINLCRSARSAKASGAADDLRPDLRRCADEILKEWDADLVIFGSVRKSEKSLRLWFMPRWGDGALSRESHVYAFDDSHELRNVRLKTGFPEDIRWRIVALATSAAAAAVDTAPLNRALTSTLETVVDKISTLLKRGQIKDAIQRSALHAALGHACCRLGEQESGTDRLERAVAAYREALKVFTREHTPLDWARVQGNLGSTFSMLGERQGDAERLEEAIAAHRAALEVFTREKSPWHWAATRCNLGNALSMLGERQGDAKCLEEAIATYRAALKVFTREGLPEDWAKAQSNLGNTLLDLSQRRGDAKFLEEALATRRAVLEALTHEHSPLDWARGAGQPRQHPP